jgi:hypothetical protein
LRIIKNNGNKKRSGSLTQKRKAAEPFVQGSAFLQPANVQQTRARGLPHLQFNERHKIGFRYFGLRLGHSTG